QDLDGTDSGVFLIDGAEEDAPEPARTYVGREGRFEIVHEVDSARAFAFTGTFTKARELESEEGTRAVELVLEGPLWKLVRRKDSRAFRDMTVGKIVKKVLEVAGVTTKATLKGPAFDVECHYVVQYEELDIDFLSRFLGERGVSFTLR